MLSSNNITVGNGNKLVFRGKTYSCAVGKNGVSSNKKEGDGATPIGIFPLRKSLYRADRLEKPQTKLPLKIIHENDGWCDDPKSPNYNRHVKLPYAFSHEMLWREDHCYDLVIPMGYNDDPVVPGGGSAIFLHVMHEDNHPTEGCIALAKADLLAILPALTIETKIEIQE